MYPLTLFWWLYALSRPLAVMTVHRSGPFLSPYPCPWTPDQIHLDLSLAYSPYPFPQALLKCPSVQARLHTDPSSLTKYPWFLQTSLSHWAIPLQAVYAGFPTRACLSVKAHHIPTNSPGPSSALSSPYTNGKIHIWCYLCLPPWLYTLALVSSPCAPARADHFLESCSCIYLSPFRRLALPICFS